MGRDTENNNQIRNRLKTTAVEDLTESHTKEALNLAKSTSLLNDRALYANIKHNARMNKDAEQQGEDHETNSQQSNDE